MKLTKSKFMLRLSMLAATLLLALMATTVYAGFANTNNFYLWDLNQGEFLNSTVDAAFGGAGMPVFRNMNDFDASTYTTATGPGFCGVGTGGSTQFGGLMFLQLDHKQLSEAKAFDSSSSWSLVDCDFDDDDDFDSDDFLVDTIVNPPDLIADDGFTIGPYFELLETDLVTTTGTSGQLSSTLITIMKVNLDTDCDGSLADEAWIPTSGEYCFWANTQVASPEEHAGWQGANFKARFASNGGDKTVNVVATGPTAITLTDFDAYNDPQILGVFAAALLGAGLLVSIAGRMYLKRQADLD
jgi:hypothetical protein